jgi:carboxymethylenebutenolidase
MPKTVDYFFSTVSPWTYLGHERLHAMCRRYGARINVRPCDLAARIFPVSGGLPLKQRAPQRQAYRLAELKRWRDHLGIALTIEPKYFPADGEPSSRLVIAANRVSDDAAMALASAVLRGCWAQERNIADPDTLKVIMT